MRAPAFGASLDTLYAAAVQMAEWADQHGFCEIGLSEHHGADDNYLPSPLILGAAIASRTKKVRIRISALILPLHDPLRIAEDLAVLDHISGGRIEIVVGAGYVPTEFAMFNRSLSDRAELVEDGIATLKQAWSGQPFSYQGRTVRVTPTPVQLPHPPILLGGSLKTSAKRAARIADGFVPVRPELYRDYLDECKKLNKQPARTFKHGPMFLFVTENPDADWQKIAPHALHETNSYAAWQAASQFNGRYQPLNDAAALRAAGNYALMTPDECIELGKSLGPDGRITLHPLMGGMDPQLGWSSLNLFAKKVIPVLNSLYPGPP
jgi:alkanesulfonate monooxygenase SsuD/methylene tetrahydromethanopterin reductase-like flavin-dependent oxidoreductase (luciferase family)